MKQKSEIDSDLYTEIEESSQARKEILTSAIDMIKLMKKYEKIKAIKSRKYYALEELNLQLKHTHSLMNSFHALMPKVPVKEPKIHLEKQEKKKSVHEHQKEHKEQKEQAKQKVQKEKLDSFEAEIQLIQNKLSQI